MLYCVTVHGVSCFAQTYSTKSVKSFLKHYNFIWHCKHLAYSADACQPV